jgi:hypothetical protein
MEKYQNALQHHHGPSRSSNNLITYRVQTRSTTHHPSNRKSQQFATLSTPQGNKYTHGSTQIAGHKVRQRFEYISGIKQTS